MIALFHGTLAPLNTQDGQCSFKKQLFNIVVYPPCSKYGPTHFLLHVYKPCFEDRILKVFQGFSMDLITIASKCFTDINSFTFTKSLQGEV